MYSSPNTPPALSCFALPVSEFLRRTELAHDKEYAMRQQHHRPGANCGREIMWHPFFSVDFVASMSVMPLHEVAAWLGGCLSDSYNDGTALDLTDFKYLADVLREGLADNPAPLAALRLARALAWIEQEGAALLPAEQPQQYASRPAAALAV